MESMSNIPYYLDKARNGYRLGHGTADRRYPPRWSLGPLFKDFHMGNARGDLRN